MTVRRGLVLVAYLAMVHRALSFQHATFLTRKFHWRGTAGEFAARSLLTMSSVSSGGGALEDESNLNATVSNEEKILPLQKQYTLTVCMVPPPCAKQVWIDVTKARTDLKDPGLFRWPPHANLLYPFIEIKENLKDIVDKLRNATKQCEPFRVSLDSLGTFGGKNRGVLWLYPRSSYSDDDAIHDNDKNKQEPLIRLQALLEEAFPTCTDQRKSGQFTPHMTLSHFASLEDAQAAQSQIEAWWPRDVSFDLSEVYLLQRKGDDGQFLRVATISLGRDHVENDSAATSTGIVIHDPPEAFPDMPLVEEDWVREERMQLKKRRNGSWKGRRRRRGGRRRSSSGDARGPSKSTDTPEVIAAKRAARKEKRERLEQERLLANETTSSNSD
jgi:2'-5' RNA ligase